MTESVTFWGATIAYGAAAAVYLVGLSFSSVRALRWGLAVAGVGLAPHAVSLGVRWQAVGHGPFSSRFEVLSANAWVLVALLVGVSLAMPRLRMLGALVMPVAFLMMGWAWTAFDVRDEVPIIFRSAWLYLHIGFAKAFGAAVVMAGACAVAYLVKRRSPDRWSRLPAAEVLDAGSHQFLMLGFLFLGVMIVAGSLWAFQSWGRYWAWDPIETCSLATWLAYGAILHLRLLHGWRGPRMAWLTLLAVALMVLTLYVVVLVVPTIHNFYMVGGS